MSTNAERIAQFKWKPGESGNPAGRPKGARQKIENKFLDALLLDWETYGQEAIELGRLADPMGYVRMVASLLPKQVIEPEGGLDGISRDELRLSIDALQRFVAAGAAAGAGSPDGERGQALIVPPVSEAD